MVNPISIVVLVPTLDLVSQSFLDWERWRVPGGPLEGWRGSGVRVLHRGVEATPRRVLVSPTRGVQVFTF